MVQEGILRRFVWELATLSCKAIVSILQRLQSAKPYAGEKRPVRGQNRERAKNYGACTVLRMSCARLFASGGNILYSISPTSCQSMKLLTRM